MPGNQINASVIYCIKLNTINRFLKKFLSSCDSFPVVKNMLTFILWSSVCSESKRYIFVSVWSSPWGMLWNAKFSSTCRCQSWLALNNAASNWNRPAPSLKGTTNYFKYKRHSRTTNVTRILWWTFSFNKFNDTALEINLR